MAIDTIKSVAIFDGSVATADIADDAVTAAKIDDDGTGFTLGDLTVSGNTSIGTAIKPPVGLTIQVGDADNKGVNLTRLETSGNPSDNEELGSYAWNSNAEVANHLGSAEAKIVARAAQNHSGTLAGTDMEFYVKPNGTGPGSGPTEKMKIHNGGVISIPDGIVLGNGLNATTANTLDDYEEGTWTATDASGAGLTFTALSGSPMYTKIGRLVICQADIRYPTTSDGTNALIGGLPFTTTEKAGGFTMYMTGSEGALALRNSANTNNILVTLPTNQDSSVTNANLSGDQIQFTFIYQAS